MSDLIDPLDDNTYGRGGAIIGGIRSYLTGPAFERWAELKAKSFKARRQAMKHNIYAFLFQVWKELHK
jgi:hypothetical protein